ncbi:choice-of-anchor Q domain-containing protein [Tautonia plasticadhaerens]|nr:choice-of-anchor Q domain-containing protein [Tautonia plasticadhaerens]
MERRALLSTILVDTFADEVQPDATTSLREAIALAASTPGDDAVVLPAIIDGAQSSYALALGQLAVDDADALTIRSEGGPATIDALGNSRVLSISARSVVELSGLAITGGEAEERGGAIYLDGGSLSLVGSSASGQANSTLEPSPDLQVGYGGGIYNAGGTLSLVDSSVSGGAVSPHAPTNSPRIGYGGGIYNDGGSVSIVGGSVSGQAGPASADTEDDFFPERYVFIDGQGGGIYNGGGSVSIVDSSVSGRAGGTWAAYDFGDLAGAGTGGAIYSTGAVSILGSGVEGTAHVGGAVYSLGTLELDRSIVSGRAEGERPHSPITPVSEAPAHAGGIYSEGTASISRTSLSGVIFDPEAWGDGGGIENRGTMALIDTTVHDSRAPRHGPGIYNSGTLDITGGTIIGNTPSASYTSPPGLGGGIYNSGPLTITNTLIAGNSGRQSYGLGIANGGAETGWDDEAGRWIIEEGGAITITNSTIAQASPALDSDLYGYGGTWTLTNTIVGWSTGVSFEPESAHNIFGPYSVVNLTDGENGNRVGIDPMLDESSVPLPGSPAIDAGLTLGDVTADLRGISRPQGPAHDVGAFEVPVAGGPDLRFDALEVQHGQAQRSFIRTVEAHFTVGEPWALYELFDRGAARMSWVPVSWDASGNPVVGPQEPVPLDGVLGVSGDVLRFDFGPQGIGGDRNSGVGDGSYWIELDLDGDDVFETVLQDQGFHRLLGDVNGDRVVDNRDFSRILASYGTGDPEADVNGDGAVNALDRTLAIRSRGHRIP